MRVTGLHHFGAEAQNRPSKAETSKLAYTQRRHLSSAPSAAALWITHSHVHNSGDKPRHKLWIRLWIKLLHTRDKRRWLDYLQGPKGVVRGERKNARKVGFNGF